MRSPALGMGTILANFQATSPTDYCTEYHFPDVNFPKEFLCTEELVLNLISALNVKKATGVDAISARMLKATAPSIVPNVTKIFNLSLTTGRFREGIVTNLGELVVKNIGFDCIVVDH